ncbi:hypothetical protein OUZ56_030284 [Daphnia magna]|uniref:Uncharacterized protein n=1 Tax=Daphnia magna TaxID=35525 RepID=A0ABQ9ZQU6_9CRUS|nr:hypothetical protein OUZ56_030284 [Daphnia magna]
MESLDILGLYDGLATTSDQPDKMIGQAIGVIFGAISGLISLRNSSSSIGSDPFALGRTSSPMIAPTAH